MWEFVFLLFDLLLVSLRFRAKWEDDVHVRPHMSARVWWCQRADLLLAYPWALHLLGLVCAGARNSCSPALRREVMERHGRTTAVAPGARGNCGFSNVGWKRRHGEIQRETFEFTSRDTMRRSNDAAKQKKKWKRKEKGKGDNTWWEQAGIKKNVKEKSLCSSHAATNRRPIWPQVHCKGTWGLKHVHRGLISNKFIRRHHPESLNILRKAL